MAKLVWASTGDYIDLDVCDHQLYEYFVFNLNAVKINRYNVEDFGFQALSNELLENFAEFKNFMKTKLKSDVFDFDIDPSNQTDLNRLHRTWVKYQQQHSNITRLFDRQTIDRINVVIHEIEKLTYKIELVTDKPNQCFKNIFDKSVLKHGLYNLVIDFNNLGRYSYNKWQYNDPVNDSDTNNFDDIYTTLILQALPSEEYELPTQYRNWCHKHNIECVGSILPLANFDNTEQNLVKYRQLILTNSFVKNNFIFLE